MRIAILDDYQNVALRMADWSAVGAEAEIVNFTDHQSAQSEIARRLADFDAVVIMRERTPFPASLIERLPRLRLLVTTGMRNAAVDLEAASLRGITVCGTPHHSISHSTVELAWGLILSVVRGIPRHDASVRAGGWQLDLGRQLHGLTLGVIGLGKLGSAVATIGQAFGMKVVAWSPNLDAARAQSAGVSLAESRDALLAVADVVTIHLVLGPHTRALIDRSAFEKMKPGAFLVNTSRAAIVDQEALIDALSARRIAGAALDVYEIEPLPADHPLRSLGNTVLTPHIGYVTAEQYAVHYRHIVENIRAFVEGEPINVIAFPGGR